MAEIVSHFETVRRICSAVLRGEEPSSDLPDGFAATALALAERHRVVPLLAVGAPSDLRNNLRRRTLALAQQAVRLEHELASIATRWSSAGIDFLVLKGPALARQAYAKPEWRSYDDLDLWVETIDLPAAIGVLENAGYRRTSVLKASTCACAARAGIEVSLRHPESGRLIELAHGWRALAPSRFAARAMKDSSVSLTIEGVPIRALSPIHSLLFGCAHGAHHRWDRLSWVVDVAGLCWRMTVNEREEACIWARRWGMETVLAVGLRLAAEQLGVEASGTAEKWIASPRVAALVQRVKLEEIGPDSMRVSMIERLSFERDVQDSAWRRWNILARWVFNPTLGDMEAFPLPLGGFPVYWIVRPLRLLIHPWRGEWRKLIWNG